MKNALTQESEGYDSEIRDLITALVYKLLFHAASRHRHENISFNCRNLFRRCQT